MTTQISLSLELVCLVGWLLKHEKTLLNNIVKQAIEHGFVDELATIESDESQQTTDHLYNTIVDFLEFLEQSLLKNLESVHLDQKVKDSILPMLQKLEAGSMDFKTVWLSMQQTKTRINKAQKAIRTTKPIQAIPRDVVVADEREKDPMDVLFEQLIKNWKPSNKETVN